MSFDEEVICPICKHSISPIYVEACQNAEDTATVLNYCRACQNAFITTYRLTFSHKDVGMHYDAKLVSSEPQRFKEETFDEKIVSLSSQFTKIYNQALAAESYALDEIAGIGYRKALEFLVKDFAIHEYPEKAEEIKALPLARCIKCYIENEQIANLAEKSAWIGNDETNYIRKQENRDISDMKSFIKAMVYFIGMVLITEDAATMSAK